jgi:adenine/guanine/hypoxanthine permease
MLERAFKLRERNTTVRAEVLGGVTTFMAMAYIIVVNPAILSFAVGIGLLCLIYYLFGLPH